MNPAKCTAHDYINFLIATPRYYGCTEVARVQPSDDNLPAHDSLNRLLYRLNPNSESLWIGAVPYVKKDEGILVIDDSILDKPYAQKMELVTRHWSGKHKQVVLGINLWTDGDGHISCDYHLYNRQHGNLTKNNYFQARISTTHQRGFHPECVVMASVARFLNINEKGIKTDETYL